MQAENLKECTECGKKERVEGEFYVGPSPYAMEMCITDEEVNELPDKVLCEECYTNSVGDI